MTTLVVEDGTGRNDANAIVSLADFKAYHADRGNSLTAYTDDQLNQAIVRASAFLANAFIWDGQKVNRRVQTMPFPRYGISDRENWPVLPTEIPRELVQACCEIGFVEAVTPGTMNPTVTLSTRVKTEQIGSIRVEYVNLFNNAADERPVLLIVQDLLWPFMRSGAQSGLSGDAVRV